jgi:hypothetical protein
MNGNKQLRYVTRCLVLIVAFASVALAEQKNDGELNLQVECVDKAIGKDILLSVIPEGGSELTLNAQCGPNVLAVGKSAGFILPTNETALVAGGAPFLIGSVRYSAGQEQAVLRLVTAKVNQFPVVVHDQEGKVVANIKCKIIIRIPMGEGTSATNWEQSYLRDVDDKGTVMIPVVEGIGNYSIICGGIDNQGVKYKGKSEWTGKELMEKSKSNAKDQALQVGVALEKPSVKVTVEWDPSLNLGKFIPEYGNIYKDVLGIEGLAGSEMLINKMGEAWFYGLKPGSHRLALSQLGKTSYTIAGSSGTVLIPDKGLLPVEHTLYLQPLSAKPIKGHVSVVDVTTGKIIDKCHVVGHGGDGKAVEPGVYELDAIAGREALVSVSHPRYVTAQEKITFNDEKNPKVIVKLKALPLLKGKVVEKGGKDPMWVHVLAKTKDMQRSITTDAEGGFELALPAGEYSIELQRYMGDPSKPMLAASPIAKALVLGKTVKIGQAGAEEVFEIEAVGEVVVDIVMAKKEADLLPPAGAILVDEQSRFVAAEKLPPNGTQVKLHAKPGKYRVYAIADDKSAARGDVVVVKPNDSVNTSVSVASWIEIELGKNRQVKGVTP